MDPGKESNYLINRARALNANDKNAGKAWIMTVKNLYPNVFEIQYEAYLIEKNANNYNQAGQCLSTIVKHFSESQELQTELINLTNALKMPEGSTNNEQEFYVKMFQNMSFDIQDKIILLITNSSETLEHCKLLLILLKRFPHGIQTHSPRLLDLIIHGIAHKKPKYIDILINDVLPMISENPPTLSPVVVHGVMSVSFEHYVKQMLKYMIKVSGSQKATYSINNTIINGNLSSPAIDEQKQMINESWKNIFNVLHMCGRILKWEPYILYNKNISKEVYWKQLLKVVSAAPPRPSENKQILFCATILFVMSIQEYITDVHSGNTDNDEQQGGKSIEYILIEGFKDNGNGKSSMLLDDDTSAIDIPEISVIPPCTKETHICLVIAAQCWQLLHANEILQFDFSQLLLNLSLNEWINRFLLDLSVYLERNDEVHKLLKDRHMDNLDKNLRLLSLTTNQSSNLNMQTFDYLLKIMKNLPSVNGEYVPNLVLKNRSNGRHLILLPLTKYAVIQYCTKLIVENLKHKILSSPTACEDIILGNLLVLLQLDWPKEHALAETIFSIIRERRNFVYLLFPKYIICTDMIEEFMSMWYPHGGDVQFEFVSNQPQNVGGSRRIGTRGADKFVKEDFKQILLQQILRSNDDLYELITQFIIDGEFLQNS